MAPKSVAFAEGGSPPACSPVLRKAVTFGAGDAPPTGPPRAPPTALPVALADWEARLADLARTIAADCGADAVAPLFDRVSGQYGRHGATAPVACRATPTGASLWARAADAVAAALAAAGAGRVPDPWAGAALWTRPACLAERHRFDAARRAWTVDTVLLKMEADPFARGAMRECRRTKKLSTFGSAWMVHPDAADDADDPAHAPRGRSLWRTAPNFVAKRYLSAATPPSAYYDDVAMQAAAKRLAEAYNRTSPPKPVDMLAAAVVVVELPCRRRDDDDARLPPPGPHALEAYVAGAYVKHSSNAGFVDTAAARATPHAFSHYTFDASGGAELVVDVQGVGDLYTDPQLVTADYAYGAGDLGPRGQALFFQSHACSELCARNGLRPFQRCDADADAVSAAAAAASSSGGSTRSTTARRALTRVVTRPRDSEGGLPPARSPSAPTLARADAPPSADLVAALDAVTGPPTDAHARLHFDVARLHAEVLALADLHTAAERATARRGGVFHLVRAAAAGHAPALGAVARAASGLTPSSGLLNALVTAALEAGDLEVDAGVAAAATRAAARVGIKAAAAAAAAAAHDAGDTVAERTALDAALADDDGGPAPTNGARHAGSPSSSSHRHHHHFHHRPRGTATTTPADVASTPAAVEAEFGGLPGGGRRRDELLAARGRVRARQGDVEGAVADYGAAAEAATDAGLGKAAAGYFEAAAALEG